MQHGLPCWRPLKKKSCIDITLTKRLNNQLQGWRVNTDYSGSDHRNILFSLAVQEKDPIKMRRWDKIDWTDFDRHLNTHALYFPTAINEKKVDKMVRSLYNTINYALDKTAPLCEVKFSGK